MTRMALIVVAMGICTPAAAQKPMPSPGVPPRLVTVLGIDQQGMLNLASHTVRFDANKPIYETRAESVSLQSAEVFDGTGQQLSAEEIQKRVAVGAAVLISADGKKVDSVYLKLLAKEALILVAPPTLVEPRRRDTLLFRNPRQ